VYNVCNDFSLKIDRRTLRRRVMKSIYVLLTRTGTIVSRMIYVITADPYTHSCISFDDGLDTLYSFTRKYPRLPLPAGLYTESLYSGNLKRFGYMPCALYELKVEDDIYEAVKGDVESMMADDINYKYNLIGLALCKFGIPHRRKRHYFCSQFVSEVLKRNGAYEMPKDTSLMRPMDYLDLPDFECVFSGDLKTLAQNREAIFAGEFNLISA